MKYRRKAGKKEIKGRRETEKGRRKEWRGEEKVKREKSKKMNRNIMRQEGRKAE